MRFVSILSILLFSLAVAMPIAAQEKSTGTIKGTVKVETGSPAGVAVIVRNGDDEIARVVTDKKGDFVASRLRPGVYGLTFRKTGLSVGTIEKVEVKPGKTRSLGNRLVLTIDEGAIAFIRGSVFSPGGKSVPSAKVELARILEDGSIKKIDGRITNETGSFVFRLMPEPAKYRLTVRPDKGDPITKDVEIDGPSVYRVALSLTAPKE